MYNLGIVVKLNISQKTVALFLVTSLLPLAAINLYWLRSEQDALRTAAAQRQSMLTSNAAERVNQFVTTKINTVILHSQTSSVQQFQLDLAQQELAAFMYQDSDLERVSLVDATGQERLVMLSDTSKPQAELSNVSSSDAFRAATFLAGKEYISDVTLNEKKQPFITIAVPLVSFETRQSLGDLSTAERGIIRSSDDIKGVLIADINMENLWESVLSGGLGDQGYAYVVDARGSLITHPNTRFENNTDLGHVEQVAAFIKNKTEPSEPAVTVSEQNVEVLSSHYPVEKTGWAVIAQEPVENIFAPANEVATASLIIFAIAATIAIILSLLFSRTLIRPIRRLVDGASQIGKGNLDMTIPVDSTDEIGKLAEHFNTMAANLKSMVKNLRTESVKLGIVLNSVNEGIIAVDANNRIAFANVSAGALVGSTPVDIKGKSFSDVFTLSKNNKAFSPDFDNTGVSTDITHVSPSNKQLHYLDVYIHQIKDDPSGIKSIITLRDKTDERELEMMKLDFVSMAAHELRTPITAIRGYLGLVSSDNSSSLSSKTQQFIERAQASTSQLVGLISNLLNVSKIERGTLSMSYDKIDWAAVARDSVRDHEFSAKEKSISLTYEGPESGVHIIADELAIKEVINNLISNAIHYTGQNGHIAIKLEVDDSEILTTVEDNGAGIPKSAIPRLFTKFYRVRGGIASGSGGTGLGLYISRSIIEMHKGRIWVESEEGVGSQFKFSLPLYTDDLYSELVSKPNTGVKKSRGWITKNIAR